MNYGMRVTLTLKTGEEDILRNVTEIYYDEGDGLITFYSWFHSEEIAYRKRSVKSWEAKRENTKAERVFRKGR